MIIKDYVQQERNLMKQQTPLFIAMGILVLYSLIFLQEKSSQDIPLSECINNAKNNSEQKQIAPIKVDVSKSRLKHSESGLWLGLELYQDHLCRMQN